MGKTSKRTKKFIPKLKRMQRKWAQEKKNKTDIASATGQKKKQKRKNPKDRKKQLKTALERDGFGADAVENGGTVQPAEDTGGFDMAMQKSKKAAEARAERMLKETFGGMEIPSDDEEELEFSSDGEQEALAAGDLPYGFDAEESDSDEDGAQLEKELASHREELQGLKKKDPAFYKELEKDKEMEPIDSDEDTDEEEQVKRTLVTEELFRNTYKQAAQGSSNALKRIISMFASACHFMEDEDLGKADQKLASSAKYKYRITDSFVYNELMLFGIVNVPKLLDARLKLEKRAHLEMGMDAASDDEDEQSGSGSDDEGGEDYSDNTGDDSDNDDEPVIADDGKDGELSRSTRATFGSGTLIQSKLDGKRAPESGEKGQASSRTKTRLERLKDKAARLCSLTRRRGSGFKTWRPAIRSFLSNLMHFLQNCPHSEDTMLGFVLQQVEKYMHLFAPFGDLSKLILKIMVGIWQEGEDSTCILAFMVIRGLALVLPYPFSDVCMKACYLSYIRTSKFYSRKIMPKNRLLLNCAVEIFGTEFKSAYQIAFVHLRQLAMTLRAAIVTKTQVSQQAVYNWSYISAIRFFSALLVRFSDNSDLQLLQHPFFQIVLGVINLIPNHRYYPLRFHCIRALNDVAEATGTFVPVVSLILHPLETITSRTTRPSRVKTKHVDFAASLTAGSKVVGTIGYEESAVEQAIDLLLDHFACHATSIAFPELALPACVILKRFAKAMYSTHRNAVTKIRGFVKVVERHVDWIKKRRRGATFAPKDRHSVQNFLKDERVDQAPLMVYRRQQQEIREAMEARMSDKTFEEELDGGGSGSGSDSDGSDEDGDEMDSEEYGDGDEMEEEYDEELEME